MTAPGGAVEHALARAAWQPVLLAERPRRLDLLRLRADWPTAPRTVRVHRNHAVEHVVAAWRPFCAFAGLDLEAVLGPYDDTLGFDEDPGRADVHLVCLDFERFRGRAEHPGDGLVEWLADRVAELARRSGDPVVVTNWPAADAGAVNEALARALAPLPGVVVADVAAVAAEYDEEFLVPAHGADTGTSWSGAAAVAVARELGLRWLPAVLVPPVKAVLVDLDGTLHDGVLGEDGAAGIEVTAGHRRLQEHLVELHRQGVYLGVVSRNDPDDVAHMFAARPDHPLRPEMVSASAVGWGSKADGVARVAEELRVGLDAVVLLDDNPGELASVAAAHPAVRTLHAASPEQALRALQLCPGLFRFTRTADDALRSRDLAVAPERAAALSAAADPGEYLRALRVELRVRRDHPDDRARVAQLTARTNQFSTALLRLGEAELAARRSAGSLSWVTVSLRDRLADSGVVAVVLAHRAGPRLVVEGISISCRALGRRIETVVVESALAQLAADTTEQVVLHHATGARNGPARDWLAGYAGAQLGTSGEVVVTWDGAAVADRLARSAVGIRVGNEVGGA